ncbi:hypothetical protein FACS189475_09250 [Betaproteobacteria bacterium]|nr:hypothetical protein FACS189475_09250 [Betaproteobacteria bacterium]
MSKEEVGIEAFGDPLMVCKFLAIIRHQRVNTGRKRPQQREHGLRDRRRAQGHLQIDRGDLVDAARTLKDSLPAAYGNPDYLGFSGHLQQRLGNGKEAADMYQAAIRLAPDDGRWWLGLGLAMESEGRNDQAVAAFEHARQCRNLSQELRGLIEQKLRQ